MQIKIEIDVKPEELRRFLGLPDVAGLQDDVVKFLREKVGAAGENFDPAAVIQGSLDLIKRTSAWRIVRDVMLGRDQAASIVLDPPPEVKRAPRARSSAPRDPTAKAVRKGAKKRKTVAAPAPADTSGS